MKQITGFLELTVKNSKKNSKNFLITKYNQRKMHKDLSTVCVWKRKKNTDHTLLIFNLKK